MLTAWQVRNSQYGGEKWYEIQLSDGTLLDTRAYNPFASYLFAADLIKRSQDGTMGGMSGKEIIAGIAGVQLRAGAGLYVLDSLFDGIGQYHFRIRCSIGNVAGFYSAIR